MVRWESELIPILSTARQQLGRCNEVAMEVPSGYGIADLVLFEFNQAIVDERVRSGLNPIEQANLLRILIELQNYRLNESVNVTMLRKKVPFMKTDLITYLVENNFLIPDSESDKSGFFRKGSEYQNGLQEVVAIEAKLRDWKRGLFQAYRYRVYADKSYLAVYTKAINAPLRNLEDFKKFNVGLIEVADSHIQIHYKPRKEKRTDSLMKAIAYENILASQENLFPDVQEVSSLLSV